jgi:Leucine-rich repeat (LRR) protein
VELEVRENQLSSSLPSEIVLLSNLRVLSARENQITGTIPADIGRMTALELLQLMQNQLTGTIPFLGSLTALIDLNIRDNKV